MATDDLEDEADATGAASERERGKESPKRAVSECGHNLATVITQTAMCATAAADSVLRPLMHKSATSLGWNANAGHVIEVLCRSMGLDFSKDGKRLWRRAEPDASVLHWREPKSANSRQPKEQRGSALGGLDAAELQHDAGAAGTGSAAAQRAAEAAQLEPPRVLELVKPDAGDKLKRGTGWGNVPRALTRRCIAEQECLDSLVLIAQEHALSCGAPL
eukprot:5089613-Prymnesium_polylepis.2